MKNSGSQEVVINNYDFKVFVAVGSRTRINPPFKKWKQMKLQRPVGVQLSARVESQMI